MAKITFALIFYDFYELSYFQILPIKVVGYRKKHKTITKYTALF